MSPALDVLRSYLSVFFVYFVFSHRMEPYSLVRENVASTIPFKTVSNDERTYKLTTNGTKHSNFDPSTTPLESKVWEKSSYKSTKGAFISCGFEPLIVSHRSMKQLKQCR